MLTYNQYIVSGHQGRDPTFVNIWRSRDGRAGTGGWTGHIKIRV